ncbi:cytochrome P450 [Nocardia sp. BMG51109]|uniref:cytochrome P450 n=1 Tax=Nocardia sp. BMG51109 TaxID=1056816 RepID=UPI000467A0C4|nr:cytochrome P450 [Nocardia sp. BMG51109]
MSDVTEPATSVPRPRAHPFDPPPEYRALREQEPVARVVLPTRAPAWALTRHADIRQMLSDPRFSSDRRNPGYPALSVELAQAAHEFTPSLIGMDQPEHLRARRALTGEFTVRRVNLLRSRIQQIVDDQLDFIFGLPQPVDLVETLALPVPSLVTCELLGVPYTDHAFFQDHTARLVRRTTPVPERFTAFTELRTYFDDLVAGKERTGSDDLLGRQITRQREEAGAVDREALAALAFLILVGGYETTANTIATGIVALLTHPDQLAKIRQDPAKTPAAVDELLRYLSVAEFATARVATADVEIGGVLIRAGEGVVPLDCMANRDPDAFSDPDKLDIERPVRHHIAFGYGPHQCIGQHLARLELRIVFDTLFRRMPGLRLAVPIGELSFKDDANIYGLDALPVTW